MPFVSSSRSRAWFGLVRGCVGAATRGLSFALCVPLACFACSAPDAKDLFTSLAPIGGSGGATSAAGSGGSSAPDASSTGAGGREGQAGALGLAGEGGNPGGGAHAGPPLADSGVEDAGSDAASVRPDVGEPPPACVATREVCDGLDNDCDGVADQGATCVAECDGFSIEGRGYMYCSAAVNRAEALGRCELEGMHLVWIDSAAEQAALIAAIAAADVPAPGGNPERLTQIGASDAAVEGVWRWVGTTQIEDSYQFWQGGTAAQGGQAVGGAFANWDDTEPNNSPNEDCALIAVLGGPGRASGAWDDRGCAAAFPFACEQP